MLSLFTPDLWGRLRDLLVYQPNAPLIFNTGLFLFLFAGVSLLYYLLRRKTTARLLFLTLFSYYFYYKSSGVYVVLLALVTLTDYFIARGIARSRQRTHSAALPKLLLTLSILIDLGLLVYFKYTNFFLSLWGSVVGSPVRPLDIFLPIGISFFTFRSISYTVDVYKGKLPPITNLLDYSFFVSFFPVLLAGPIVRATDFARQIRTPLRITPTMTAQGVYMILVGLLKKAVISDYISLNFVDRVFDNPALYSGMENLIGLYGYTLQIYCDFSGYSDMAIGIALLLGFRCKDNFNAPFRSTSVTEFWHRWHISLSTWIRDYLYIPLGGNRKGNGYLNQLVSMLLCGLWHGAGLNFVVWGGLHGLALVGHKVLRSRLLRHPKHYRPHGIKKFFSVLLTFHFVAVMFVLFRQPEWGNVIAMFRQIFLSFHPELLTQVLAAYYPVLALILIGYLTHFVPERSRTRTVLLLKRGGIPAQVLLSVLVIYIVIQVKSSEISPFIYFQF